MHANQHRLIIKVLQDVTDCLIIFWPLQPACTLFVPARVQCEASEQKDKGKKIKYVTAAHRDTLMELAAAPSSEGRSLAGDCQ